MTLNRDKLKEYAEAIIKMHDELRSIPPEEYTEELHSFKNHLESAGFHLDKLIKKMKGQANTGNEDVIARKAAQVAASVNKMIVDAKSLEVGQTIIDELKKQLEEI